MVASKPGERRLKTREPRHEFCLNPYGRLAFTRCPKCDGATKARKHCLVIHIEPALLVSLNKTCRFCPSCDLLIAKQAELGQLLAAMCAQQAPELLGNEYFVFGTMDRQIWKAGQQGALSQREALEQAHPFKNEWKFELERPRTIPDKPSD